MFMPARVQGPMPGIMSPGVMGAPAAPMTASPHGPPPQGFRTTFGSAGYMQSPVAPSPASRAPHGAANLNPGSQTPRSTHTNMPQTPKGANTQRPPMPPTASRQATTPQRTANQQPLPPDPEGHFVFNIGDKMERTSEAPQGRYTIVKLLGAGVYGKVVKCEDSKYNGCHVAVKVVRNQPAYRAAAQREIRVLRHLQGKEGLVQLLKNFEHRGHVCISMELCGKNLKDELLEIQKYSLKDVQSIGKQILNAIKHMHSCGIIHTDIKTDNILLSGTAKDGTPLIKVADLGSATYKNEWHPDLIGTKEYRAPEAVLQVGWHDAADIWSIGCVMFELVAGHMLFRFEEEEAYLPLLELTLGKPLPAAMVQRAWQKRNQHSAKFMKLNKAGNVVLTKPSGSDLKLLEEFDGCTKSLDAQMPDDHLRSLIRGMLEPHPGQRASPKRCLEATFFQRDYTVVDELGSSIGESTASSASSTVGDDDIMQKIRQEPSTTISEISEKSSTTSTNNRLSSTDKISCDVIDL